MSASSEAVKRWRKSTKQRMVEAMGGGCVVCSYRRCESSLAFHHLEPAHKDLSFGAVRSNPQSWKKLVEELRKCVLVCHNCHGEIHDGVAVVPVDAARFNEDYADYKVPAAIMDSCPVCGGPKIQAQKTCSRKCIGKKWGRRRKMAGGV
jgi:hypothetical protein